MDFFFHGTNKMCSVTALHCHCQSVRFWQLKQPINYYYYQVDGQAYFSQIFYFWCSFFHLTYLESLATIMVVKVYISGISGNKEASCRNRNSTDDRQNGFLDFFVDSCNDCFWLRECKIVGEKATTARTNDIGFENRKIWCHWHNGTRKRNR